MDLDLKGGFDRYARDMFGWQREMPNTLAPAAMIFQLFCLLIWQNDEPGPRALEPDARTSKLDNFLAKLFQTTDQTHPHMLITRGLSFLNYLDAPPVEQPALELGCENGLTTRLLFEEPFRYGIDITPDWAESVRESGMHGEYRVGSADAIPLPDDSVRSIVMNNVLYHVANREKSLEEVLRCLQSGGRVYFDDIAPSFFAESSRPFVAFLKASGGKNFSRDFMRKRNALYLEGRSVNPNDSLSLGEYRRYVESIGFVDVRAHYYHNLELLRLAYNFLDMGFIFGTGALASRSAAYQSWARRTLSQKLLRDEEQCTLENDGGYIFVTARKL